MLKKSLMIGTFCIGLIALWATGANAYPTRYLGGGWNPGSLVFTSTWLGAANTEHRPTEYEVTLKNMLVTVYFSNPGGNTGGVGVPFDNPGDVTDENTIYPSNLSGKGKIEDTLIFGDDDNGVLWLIWLEKATDPDTGAKCNTSPEQDQVTCIKEYLSFYYAPNPGWTPYDIKIDKFDAVVEAFTDLNKDGSPIEEVVHADYKNCTLNEDKTEYICAPICIWNYKNTDPNPPHTIDWCPAP